MQDIRRGKYEEKFKKVWLSFSDPQIIFMQVNFKTYFLRVRTYLIELFCDNDQGRFQHRLFYGYVGDAE